MFRAHSLVVILGLVEVVATRYLPDEIILLLAVTDGYVT